jgi:dipeptidyl aminopeptidase/acylaminoacyl peptidase
MRLLPRFLAVAAALGAGALEAAEPRRFGIDDLDQIVRLEGAQISPDGKSVALAVARVNLAENRRDSELVLVDVKTGAQRVLALGKAGLANPGFSPRGDVLAFLAEVGDGVRQIHLLPVVVASRACSPKHPRGCRSTRGDPMARRSASRLRTRLTRGRAPTGSRTPSRWDGTATSSAPPRSPPSSGWFPPRGVTRVA